MTDKEFLIERIKHYMTLVQDSKDYNLDTIRCGRNPFEQFLRQLVIYLSKQ